MSKEKLSMSDLLGEEVSEGTSLNQRQKWRSNPIGARGYQELTNVESQKDNLAQQLLKNLTKTKRNVSEFLEQRKMTEWLRMNSSKTEASFRFGCMRSDSGVSLCTSLDDSQDWQSSNSYLPKDKWNIDIDDNTLNLPINKKVSNCMNEAQNDFDGVKGFHTPESWWEEVGSFNTHDHDTPERGIRSREKSLNLRIISRPKGAGRSADILTRVQKSYGASSQLGNFSGSVLSDTVAEERRVDDVPETSRGISRINRPTGTAIILNRNKNCQQIGSKISQRAEIKSSSKKSSNEGKSGNSTCIAKSLKHLATVKICKQNAVAQFMKNLAGCSEEMQVKKVSYGDCTNDEIDDISYSNSSLGCPSNENMKWNFPSSNRKREEKLRSLKKTVGNFDNSELMKDSCQRQFLDPSDYEILQFLETASLDTTESEMKISTNNPQGVIQTNIIKGTSQTEMNGNGDIEASCGDGNSREMNTHAVLIHLSETLIDSAQKAEMLLMQKIKEYNDLVCRDPPERKMQDFACQVYIEQQPERNNDTRESQIQEKLTQELCDKNTRDFAERKMQDFTCQVYIEQQPERNIETRVCQIQEKLMQELSDINTGDFPERKMQDFTCQVLTEQQPERNIDTRESQIQEKLMQELSDINTRDFPERKMKDFTCQVLTEQQPERNIDTRESQIQEKLTQELCDKNTRIKQLETDKKKLRQHLKKFTIDVGKKTDESQGSGRDVDSKADSSSPRSISLEQSALNERNEDNGPLVQALKIENNLLHTLLKEMKTELDQENATILSLAKKLEMSLGNQTITKSRQQSDVVKKLEDRLEQQKKLLKQEAMEARTVAKYVIMKYKNLIQEYKQKVRIHQETVYKLTNALK